MRVPPWVYIVGICMIAFGGMGGLSGLTSSAVQETDFTSGYNDAIKKEMDNMSSDEKQALESLGLDDLSMSDEDLETQSTFTSLGLVISLMYFAAGIILLMKRKFSLKVVYITLAASILFSVIKYFAFAASESSIVKLGALAIWGFILVDVILLLVVLFVDKTQWKYITGEFTEPENPPHTYNN
ncbi:hypothetical protein OAQ99_04645 [Candidatus Kapabacteria bacterium]|nr:hypothetical protein [Candidatus Kapabacteria bacterium]